MKIAGCLIASLTNTQCEEEEEEVLLRILRTNQPRDG